MRIPHFAALVLLFAPIPLAAQSATKAPDPAVKMGVDAWSAGDFAGAVGKWRGAALAGDADAQFNMGQAYKLGRGVTADLGTALNWYQKAAAQGHVQAQDLVGITLFTMGRRDEAMPHIRTSAARGEPRAQFLLGTAHFNGDLAERDWVRAYALMTRASAAGVPNASRSLATMDQYIPLDQRQQALTLATMMERDAETARVAAATGAVIAPPRTTASATKPTTAPAVRPRVAAAAPRLSPARQPTMSAPPTTAVSPVAIPPSQAVRDPAAIPGYTPSAPARGIAVATSASAPSSPPAANTGPAAAPATGGAWRIQVAALGSIDKARSYWSGLEQKQPDLGQYQPYLVDVGSIVRVQAGDFSSEAEARAACTIAVRAGSGCFPVKG